MLVIAFPFLVWMAWNAAHAPPVDRPFALLGVGIMVLFFAMASIAPFVLTKEMKESTDADQPPADGDAVK
jgi:hypothetical protein